MVIVIHVLTTLLKYISTTFYYKIFGPDLDEVIKDIYIINNNVK